jgi:addiction module antitoxin, RelB/DinJ family
MGLSMSDAVRIFLKRVVNDQAFPLELKVPNAETRAAMEEARAMMKARQARFESADALFDELEKNPLRPSGRRCRAQRISAKPSTRTGNAWVVPAASI